MSYNRFMSGMSHGGSVGTMRGTDPVTLDELRVRVPSIFATEAHESRSDRFVPVPTIDVLEALEKEDFHPYFAQQARSRTPGKAAFTKHMIRMRHDSLSADDGTAFEIIITNANDGTAAYNMLPGFFEFLCANGLFTGDAMAPVKVRHSRNAIENVVAGAYSVLENAPLICEKMQEFKGVSLTEKEQAVFAHLAHKTRFESTDNCPVSPLQLLDTRRQGDNNSLLWSVFNRVQENLIQGRQKGVIIGKNGKERNATVKKITAINQLTQINNDLWKIADATLEYVNGVRFEEPPHRDV